MQKEKEFLSWLRLLFKTCSVSGGYLGPFSHSWRFSACLQEPFFPLLGVSCAKGRFVILGQRRSGKKAEQGCCVWCTYMIGVPLLSVHSCFCPHPLPKFLDKCKVMNPAFFLAQLSGNVASTEGEGVASQHCSAEDIVQVSLEHILKQLLVLYKQGPMIYFL